MLLTSITLCCFVLTVQSQNQFYSQLVNPDRIYFADNLPRVVPLSIPTRNGIDTDAIRKIFQDEPPKNVKPTTSVEIERSNELASSTSIERGTNSDSSGVVDKQAPIPSKETAQQIAAQRPNVGQRLPSRLAGAQVAPNRQGVTQVLADRRPVALAIPDRRLGPQMQPQPTVTPMGLNNLLHSMTNFGLNLMKNINKIHTGNMVISPYSINSLLALLQQGAWGQTKVQITNALQMTPEASAAAYAQISGDIKTRNSHNILKTATNLFVADAFVLKPEFREVAERSFNSDVTSLNFAVPDQAAHKINKWVAMRTNNKIDRLISPDSLGQNTQVVLVNTIYFKGLWEVPFRVESTIPRDFHLSNGQRKTAQYMRMRKLFKTGMDPTTNAKVIILPFEREQYSLMVILPSELVGMANTLSTLTDETLLSYLNFTPLETELELPKFTVRADTDLAVVLRNMGITNMFGQYSELNGVGTYRSFSPQISSAVHSAVLSIDEQGGSAAAATAFAAVALSYDEAAAVFKANRPFIAVLWDSASSLPLFMAKIEDPQP